jgi:hypothetical protein
MGFATIQGRRDNASFVPGRDKNRQAWQVRLNAFQVRMKIRKCDKNELKKPRKNGHRS